MVGTILPIGYGDRQHNKFAPAVFLHCLGYVLGGTAFGTFLGAAGAVLQRISGVNRGDSSVPFIAAIACLSLGARELRLCRVPYPQSTWQVPIGWRRMPLFLMAFLYALVLGTGVATRITASSFIIASLWVLLQGDALLGAIIGAAFGFGRAVAFVIGWRLKTSVSVDRFLELVSASSPTMSVITGLALSGVAGLLIALCIGNR